MLGKIAPSAARIDPQVVDVKQVCYDTSAMNPFPGMNPYLEPHWLDIQASFTVYIAEALNRLLPDDVFASIDVSNAIEPEPEGQTIQVDPIRERSIHIIEVGTQRLITVIEPLSPTKKGIGIEAYIDKRDQLLASGVNFVEIDLIRAGDWRRLLRPNQVIGDASSTYRVTIRIPQVRPAVHLYPVRLQDRLPWLSIPLRKEDPEIRLDLQAHIEHAYVSGRYDRRIDYNKPCVPPLEPEDAAWADELLKTAGER